MRHCSPIGTTCNNLPRCFIEHFLKTIGHKKPQLYRSKYVKIAQLCRAAVDIIGIHEEIGRIFQGGAQNLNLKLIEGVNSRLTCRRQIGRIILYPRLELNF